MKMDWFMSGLGLGDAGEVLPEPTLGEMAAGAEAFLRAGGTFGFSDWAHLNKMSQAALMAAGDAIWRERCAMIGDATRSELAAAYFKSKEDGHDLMAQRAVDVMVERALKKVGAEEAA